MSSIFKVRWTSGGKEKTAWAVDYFDQDRKKRRRTFKTQREAKEWDIAAQGEIKAGKHTPDSKSITVIEAMRLWLDRCRLRIRPDDDGGLQIRSDDDEKLEWSTVRAYDSHVGHIAKSSIAAIKLSRLAMPMVEAFKDELIAKGRLIGDRAQDPDQPQDGNHRGAAPRPRRAERRGRCQVWPPRQAQDRRGYRPADQG